MLTSSDQTYEVYCKPRSALDNSINVMQKVLSHIKNIVWTLFYRTDARRRVCAAMFRTAELLGERRYENLITITTLFNDF